MGPLQTGPGRTAAHDGPEALGVAIGYRGTGLRAHSIHTSTGPPVDPAGWTLTTPKVMCCPRENGFRQAGWVPWNQFPYLSRHMTGLTRMAYVVTPPFPSSRITNASPPAATVLTVPASTSGVTAPGDTDLPPQKPAASRMIPVIP